MGEYKLKAPSFKHSPSTEILTVVIFARGITGDFNDLSSAFSYLFPKLAFVLITKIILINILCIIIMEYLVKVLSYL